MANAQLVEKLELLGQSAREKSVIEVKLRLTKEEYHPKPKEKELLKATKPSKKVIQTMTCCVLACLIVGVILVASAISSYSKMSKLNGIIDDPGEKYELWLASWSNAESFSDLKEGWNDVEQDWNDRGVNVDWTYIEEVQSNMWGDIYSDRFDKELMSSLTDDADGYNMAGATKVFFALVLIIPIIICARKKKKHLKEWQKAMDHFTEVTKENEVLKKYNEEELPKLIREWEEKKPEMYAEYEKHMNSLRAKMAELDEIISQHAHLLPADHHYYAEDIASIIKRGRAHDVEEARKLYDEESQALWEKQRAARDRCSNCANSKSCDYFVKEGFRTSGEVCPAYRP